ncbi:general L-amino acid transport system permease protein [Bradyrhizobium sp. USDA 4524]|uniref:amino acid ABC transporter permease n=1 Tax=unclassified Bradyrhizobium TaxID=2631580 RepID=UPI00209F97D0|nr:MULTISPECIES: ABC transporter permease subunit [unclassified Bradyrhizobium]MCP1845545.1 general L-amino acid transport system permease protein [Bradyrhizobium sp. USDA 4538]MCP1907133.1 general L-amino acid transport system permease protein [Bradyrhizobium sp. USDA 4537]MCP1985609.1 general L-amino acid transport system permease protein [Bradyrhizobium sp. USDA 4539]
MIVAPKTASVARTRSLRRQVFGWLGPSPWLQLVILVGVAAILIVLGSNIATTMARTGVTPGFGFLENAANFEIGEGMIAFHAGDSYARAILVGLLNTAKIALLGCGFATVLGVALGVMRLSGNLMLSGLVRWYVEIVRNTPLLLQLFFWIALAHALPSPRRAVTLLDAVFLTNRGVYVPGIVIREFSLLAMLVLAAVAGIWIWLVWRGWRNKRTGLLAPLPVSLVGILVLGATFTASGTRIGLEVPAISGFNIRGGVSLTPEFAALLVGLTVKFSAIIAEIVRAGILSVRQEQWDAARALGLHRGKIMRLVVLPQALRVITPLATSSYLDLIKDSSLAVAIGYPDVMNIVNTTANTTGQAFEALLIVVLLYLTLNLAVSALMSVYNTRVALRGETSK